jgi:hypothetical protein
MRLVRLPIDILPEQQNGRREIDPRREVGTDPAWETL